MCWTVDKLIQNEGKILVLGLKRSKKEFSMYAYYLFQNQGEKSGLEFECVLRMTV
jgi:hypothetical protein